MWGYGHMLGGGWGFGIGLFFEIIFWGLIIWLIISLLRGRDTGYCGPHRIKNIENESPLEILKRRYAKGEVHKDEFESMKKDLQ